MRKAVIGLGLALPMLLTGCLEDSGGAGYVRAEGVSAATEVAGRSYRVVMVENEPFGHIMGAVAGHPASLDAGPYQPAVRIEGAAPGDLQGALRAFAAVCGHAYDNVKDWGAYGDPIWQDPRDDAVVLYTSECPGLTG